MAEIVVFVVTWFVPVIVIAALVFCFLKQLWWALATLAVFQAASMFLHHSMGEGGWGAAVAFFGLFLAFPIVMHLNSEGRDREKRRSRIRKARSRTGRPPPAPKR